MLVLWYEGFIPELTIPAGNLDVAARHGRVYRCRDFCGVQSNQRPLGSTKHHNRYPTGRKILLVSDILVRSEKDIESGPLRFG